MKTRAKGRRAVNKCIKRLEDIGCTVAEVERGGKFIKEKDAFGLFDLLSLHQDGGVCLIQVTSTKPHVHYHYEDFSRKFHKTGIVMQQWVWINYKGFKVFTYKKGEKTVEKYI